MLFGLLLMWQMCIVTALLLHMNLRQKYQSTSMKIYRAYYHKYLAKYELNQFKACLKDLLTKSNMIQAQKIDRDSRFSKHRDCAIWGIFSLL